MQPNRKPASLDPGAIDQVLEGTSASSSDEAVRRVEETIAFLRTAPAPGARPGAVRALIARIEGAGQPRQELGWRVAPWWGGALAASLLMGVFLFFRSGEPVVQEYALGGDHLEQARAWLVQAQERDGHWDAGRWGGCPAHEMALTALSLIALLDGEDMSPVRRDAVRRAGHFLSSQLQALDSPQAEWGAGARNLRLAALALIAVDYHFPDAEWREPVRVASQTLSASLSSGQTAAGGWGYVLPGDADIQRAAFDKDQVRMQAVQWLAAASAENGERLGGTVYVMARTSLLL